MPPPVTPIPHHNTAHIDMHSRHITAHINMHSHHIPWNSCQQQGRGWQQCPSFLPRRSCGVIERGQHEIHMLSPSIACTPLIRGDHFLPPAYDLPPVVSYLLYPLSLPPRCWGGFFLVAVNKGPTHHPSSTAFTPSITGGSYLWQCMPYMPPLSLPVCT